ncbi:hypothetical protein StoSoilA2_41210 [Arthrobacter sp. StoSoilA2]|nr:hypothetical protein StoSoilA2_41210 [Arthrobacter sp. StoSoilA2]
MTYVKPTSFAGPLSVKDKETMLPGPAVAADVRVTTVGRGTIVPPAVARGGGTAIASAEQRSMARRM